MRVYSNSALDALADCQEKGLDALLMQRHAKAGPARQGQFAHYVHQRYVQHLYDTKRDSDVETGEGIIRRAIGVLGAEDAEGTVTSTRKWMEHYSAEWLLNFKWLLLEERLHVHIDEPDVAVDMANVQRKVPIFAMTGDAIGLDEDNCLHVLDGKNGWNVKHVSDPLTNRQLLRYAGPFAARFKPDKVFLHVEHFRHSNRETSDPLSTDHVAEAWQDLVVAPVRRWEATLSKDGHRSSYTVGGHCVECDIRGRCPAYARYPGEADALADHELVDAEAVLSAKLKAVRARLKDVIAASDDGKVKGDTHVASYSVSDRVEYEPSKTRAILLDYVTEDMLNGAFTTNKTSIDRMLKQGQMKPAQRKEVLERLAREAGDVTKVAKLSVKKQPKREANDEG